MTSTAADAAAPVDAPARWSALAVLAGAMVLAMSTWFSAAAVLPTLVERWELTDGQRPWLTIAVQLGFVAGAVAAALANLPDRVPPRRLVFVGATGAAVANLALLVAGGFWPALAARTASGAFLALVYGPALAVCAGWFRPASVANGRPASVANGRPSSRGTALGIMVGALTLGSALPHFVNGVGGADWRIVVVGTSALSFVGGAVVVAIVRDGPFAAPPAPFDPSAVGRLVRDRRYRLVALGYLGHMWELYAMWAWIPTFLAVSLGTGASTSLVAAAVIGAGAAGSVVAGRVGDRKGRSFAAGASMVASGLVALVVGFLVDAPAPIVVGVALVWGFAVVADSAQFSTLATEVVPRDRLGTAVTLQLAAGFVLSVLTIWLVPELVDALGWGWAFAALAPGPAIGTWAMWRLSRDGERVGQAPSRI